MNEKQAEYRRSVQWSALFMVGYSALCIAAILCVPLLVIQVVGISGGFYLLINAFFVKYKKEALFVNGLLSAVSVMNLGIWAGHAIDLEGVLALGATISVIDVLSFTKYGKKTANAKAMSNPHFMFKLIVYGKTKEGKLVPTSGIGDYFYYAFWISGIHTVSSSVGAYLAAALLIFTGTMIDSVIIGWLYQKENYKGFPATIIPFALVAMLYLMLAF